MLPDDYIRKRKQDLPESEAPRTGGFATLVPKEDIDYAIQVFHEMQGRTSCRCELRFEPELGWPDGHGPRPTRKQ
jgi:hypothetical protein